MFLLFHVNFSIILHTVSIWYTLVLAVWRFIMIKFHTVAVTHCTRQKCSVLLVLGYGEEHKSYKRYKAIFSCNKTN